MAEKAHITFSNYETPVTTRDIKDAAKLRLRTKVRKIDLSYADAIGYMVAERTEARFLTGDDSFQHLSNVEFVR